uniref:Uncharacterized protein n=1 Tax=Oryza rufipogon TaxID=4529 RepID=A0A0E0R8H5_ORYRU
MSVSTPGRRVGIRRPSGGAVTAAGGGRAHHAHLAAAATRPEAPSASSPNDRGTRSAACIARDDLAEAARLVDRSRGEAPDAAVAAAVKTNAGEVRESKHQAHTAAPVVRGRSVGVRRGRPLRRANHGEALAGAAALSAAFIGSGEAGASASGVAVLCCALAAALPRLLRLLGREGRRTGRSPGRRRRRGGGRSTP